MPNEHKRFTEIFRCSLNSLRKFSIVFCHFWVPYIFFKFCPWSGRLRKTWRIIKKNKKGNFFPVHLDLKGGYFINQCKPSLNIKYESMKRNSAFWPTSPNKLKWDFTDIWKLIFFNIWVPNCIKNTPHFKFPNNRF